jgi:hypothetical protein
MVGVKERLYTGSWVVVKAVKRVSRVPIALAVVHVSRTGVA